MVSLFSINSFSLEASPSSAIKAMQVYPDYGGGDFTFYLESKASECVGYWVSKNSPAYNTTVSMLLAAFHASANILVYGHTEESAEWTGAGTKYCKVYTVAIAKS